MNEFNFDSFFLSIEKIGKKKEQNFEILCVIIEIE